MMFVMIKISHKNILVITKKMSFLDNDICSSKEIHKVSMST